MTSLLVPDRYVARQNGAVVLLTMRLSAQANLSSCMFKDVTRYCFQCQVKPLHKEDRYVEWSATGSCCEVQGAQLNPKVRCQFLLLVEANVSSVEVFYLKGPSLSIPELFQN